MQAKPSQHKRHAVPACHVLYQRPGVKRSNQCWSKTMRSNLFVFLHLLFWPTWRMACPCAPGRTPQQALGWITNAFCQPVGSLKIELGDDHWLIAWKLTFFQNNFLNLNPTLEGVRLDQCQSALDVKPLINIEKGEEARLKKIPAGGAYWPVCHLVGGLPPD